MVVIVVVVVRLFWCVFPVLLACPRLRDSWARWIERARRRKYYGRKLRRDGAAEPVIISLNDPFRYTSSWYTLWLVRFDRLYQHSQSGSFLSLRKMACGVLAREIEKSTITSVLNECLWDFPHTGALRKEQKTCACLVNLAQGKNVFTFPSSPLSLSESLEQARTGYSSVDIRRTLSRRW